MEQLVSFTLTVEQGDTLARIADEHGFSDYKTIWDRPENAELRQQRDNPNVLSPGDKIFIPDKTAKTVTCATGSAHRFTLKGTATRLRLVLLDLGGAPLKNTAVELTVEGQTSTVHTDGNGLLDQVLPPHAQDATVRVGEIEYDIKIGHLDPPDQQTGLVARLRNMGYLAPGADSEVDPDELKFAVELFQRDHQLTVDGSDTSQVEQKMKDIYGC